MTHVNTVEELSAAFRRVSGLDDEPIERTFEDEVLRLLTMLVRLNESMLRYLSAP